MSIFQPRFDGLRHSYSGLMMPSDSFYRKLEREERKLGRKSRKKIHYSDTAPEGAHSVFPYGGLSWYTGELSETSISALLMNEAKEKIATLFPSILPKNVDAFRKRISSQVLGLALTLASAGSKSKYSKDNIAPHLTIVPHTTKGRKGPRFDIYVDNV